MKQYERGNSGTVERARKLRRDMTEAEKLLWRKLREAFPDAKFRRQSPVPPYYPDFLSYRHKLIIEADGGQHDPLDPAEIARTRFFEEQNFRVLRFWNHDILANSDGVLETVRRSIQGTNSAS
ncbi:endonuclease domain-containing protein [Qipengyuania sp. DSG2-2]|uniref:endonuclease domain-containing protein n=1 Tax=Qipengyuania sp. DGS2-2 TaxID=3349631 RepID=UPI0036D2ADA6